MGKLVVKKPQVRVQQISADLMDVDFTFVSQLVAHAGAFYLRLPKKEMEFWDIRPEDELHLKVSKIKRERELDGNGERNTGVD